MFANRKGRALFPRQAWEKAVETAGVSDFRFHDLRHTFASYALMSGATLAELMHLMGHRSPQMVQRYAHVADEHSGAVVERMAAKFLEGRHA